MNHPYKIGLKLYSTNTDLIGEALALKHEFFDYVELYVLPGSHDETVRAWREFEVPYVIHAPHSSHGVNLAQRELRETNAVHIREAQDFADALQANLIIVHGGNNGTLEETMEQIRRIGDSRFVLENKPKIGLFDEICVGWSPDEFRKCLSGQVDGIALDFGHASCAARSLQRDVMQLVREFMSFRPRIFHISDSDGMSEQDQHCNLGEGNLDLFSFLEILPRNALLTIETPRRAAKGLADFVDDVNYLRSLSIDRGSS